MKSPFNLFRNLVILLAVSLTSCEKDLVTSDLRIVESVTVAEVIDFQHEFLLESIANSFDNQILPFGVTRNYLDTNRLNEKFQLDFGKMQLCGDYISRTGKVSISQFNSSGNWDSLTCEILPGDSFGILSEFGTIYLVGTFKLKRKDAIQVESVSKFNFYIKNGRDFQFTSNCIVSRVKKVPTKLDFHDGMVVWGQCHLMKANSSLNIETEILNISKPVDAPNFPIAGALSCKLNSGETVDVFIDPYTNLQFDKVAKGKFGDSEWFFNFQ